MASNDEFLWPARKILERYAICDRTLDRWLKDEKMAFPKPAMIRKRRYFRAGDIAAWEIARAIGQTA
jgi:hypothetical protein